MEISLTKKGYGITEGRTDGRTDICKPVYPHFFKARKQIRLWDVLSNETERTKSKKKHDEAEVKIHVHDKFFFFSSI